MVSTHQACSEQAHPLWPAAHFRLFEQPTPHHGTYSPACPAFSHLAESEAYGTSRMRRQPWEKSSGVFIQNTRQLGT